VVLNEIMKQVYLMIRNIVKVVRRWSLTRLLFLDNVGRQRVEGLLKTIHKTQKVVWFIWTLQNSPRIIFMNFMSKTQFKLNNILLHNVPLESMALIIFNHFHSHIFFALYNTTFHLSNLFWFHFLFKYRQKLCLHCRFNWCLCSFCVRYRTKVASVNH